MRMMGNDFNGGCLNWDSWDFGGGFWGFGVGCWGFGFWWRGWEWVESRSESFSGMATKTMSPEEHRQVALEFLAASDEAFERDEVVEGAMKLWEAAAHKVTAAAVVRGWPVGDRRLMKSAAVRLAKELDEPMIAGGYAVAEEFSRHRSRDWMEDWQRDADRPLVQAFVERVLEVE